MDEETWKPVVNLEGIYSVSSVGRVRRDGAARGTRAGFILKAALTRGYPQVVLRRDGTHYSVAVHSLVMAAFVGPRPAGMEVNHKNGIKTDNRLQNLEYVTPSENMLHAYRNGLMPRPVGELRHTAILTEAAVRLIKAALAQGERQRTLARRFGVSESAIGCIAHGRSWRHVA